MASAVIAPPPAQPEWKFLLERCVGTKAEHLDRVIDGWASVDPSLGTGAGSTDPAGLQTIRSQLEMIIADVPVDDWPTTVDIVDRFRAGVYSPVQVLLWRTGEALQETVEFDYPFLFGPIAMTCQVLLQATAIPVPPARAGVHQVASWPLGTNSFRSTRRLLQTCFQLRELREEGEPLSVEIKIPSSPEVGQDLGLKRFSQVFGRGVGVAEGEGLTSLARARAGLNMMFHDHGGAPMTNLYTLGRPYSSVPLGELRLILRRDGMVTMAMNQNPLLEFYDGGWHVVDLHSGLAAVNTLIDRMFPSVTIPENLSEVVVALAYHMATHWHPGIIGVIDTDKPGGKLEPPSPDSIRISEMLLEEARKGDPQATCVRITDVGSHHLGRALMTCAIQDGATLFRADGTFDSSARMLQEIDQNIEGGAGTRAAKMLAKWGVAIKVSRDGGIRLFAGDSNANLVPVEGLRIR